MRPFEEMTDEELIRSLREGRTEIMDYILEKYKLLVRRRANAMFLIGGEPEDLIQEGMIGLFKAIRDFKEERETSFFRFADLCVTRQIYRAVEASQRKKHQPLNSYVSLNDQEGESSGSVPQMFSVMEDANPEQMFIDRETAAAMEEQIMHVLSKMEKQVMEHYLKGLNYHQIAEAMGKKPKAIDNALQRIKGKLGGIRKEIR